MVHERTDLHDFMRRNRFINHQPSTITHDSDTIVALSSPAGRSARAIVRLSGPAAVGIAAGMFAVDSGESLASAGTFRCLDGEALPERLPCRLYLMRAPRSYTREDVVELHLAGNPVIAELVLEAAVDAGARLAAPGEFTRRAVENGRLSPEGAEAVISLIRARSRAELVAAAGQLSGTAGRGLGAWRERAAELAAELEAELDYGEEPGEFLEEGEAARRLGTLASELDALSRDAGAPRADPGLVRCALAGPTNAGKSLLLARLTGRDVLVSAERGTTRDVLEAPLAAAPDDLALLDAAGLGAAAGEVELLARAAAERAWRGADLMLLVLDRSERAGAEEVAPALAAAREAEIPLVLVLNKCDLPPALSGADVEGLLGGLEPVLRAEVSALTGAGCQRLSAGLAALVGEGGVERSPARAAAGARRREVLSAAREALARAEEALATDLGLACAADDLGEAVRLVVLQFEPGAGAAQLDEEVLDRIFARFCVGK
jgi:tRNA modification GTPase